MSPRKEARLIVQSVLDEFGKSGTRSQEGLHVDGRKAILEMKKRNWNWREVEWPGFYLKRKIPEICIEKYETQFQERNIGKLYLLKGTYIWDIRFNALGKTQDNIPFMSKDNIDGIIEEYGGLGLIVVDAEVDSDDDWSFYRWLQEKKGVSSYELERERNGRAPRKRKKGFRIRQIHAYYFPEEHIHRGPREGWINPNFQRDYRQPGGEPRAGKYQMYLGRIPRNFKLDKWDLSES